MKKTNYADIASRYDDNLTRHDIPVDEHLRRALTRCTARPLGALDIGCGTGNYLAAQRKAFGADVRWEGLDASPEMLARAKPKLEGVPLTVGRAESLPWEDASFDYVTSSFAFHHFEDKPRALDEMRRVCRPGASLRIVNIDPSRMLGAWEFRFFPETLFEDQKRFWSAELMYYELEQRGFRVRAHVDFDLAPIALRTILADVERREISELAIISEHAYAAGLARVREALARAPEGEVTNEFAIAYIECVL
jgi:ubiquinone/menaquinone biosynthesis C-methylase UbiE